VARCFGITRNLNRCNRTGEWDLFCKEHRRQPLVWLVFIIFTVVAGAASIYSALQSARTEIQHTPALGASKSGQQATVGPAEPQIIAQRAYVSVSDANISDVTGANAPTVAINIKNTGLTPAYDLTWRAIFGVTEYPITREIRLDRKKVASTIVLPPGGVLSYKWTFPEWKKEWSEMISKGDAAIFAIGEITYNDAFGKTRFTKYRLIHGGDSMVSPGKFGPAADGNKAT
jgi:hypothetical protein